MVTHTTNSQANEYALRHVAVYCPECGTAFATECLSETPVSVESIVMEADLHRVYPDPKYRASLIAVCPECSYAGGIRHFTRCPLKAEVIVEAPPIDHPQKFALAISSGRKHKIHPLDLAYLALNGLWCAREAGQKDQLWLELVAFEHHKALSADDSVGDKGQAHFLMGEIWRQMKDFEAALKEYDLALSYRSLPTKLIELQIEQARKSNSAPTQLPAHIIQELLKASDGELDFSSNNDL